MLRVLFNSDFFKEGAVCAGQVPGRTGSRYDATQRQSNAAGTWASSRLRTFPASWGRRCSTRRRSRAGTRARSGSTAVALVERVNFAAKEISNINAPGVRLLLDRLADDNGGEYTATEIVDACLDIMGTAEMDIELRAALIAHVGIKGDRVARGPSSRATNPNSASVNCLVSSHRPPSTS